MATICEQNQCMYYQWTEKWNSCAVFLRVDAYVMHNIIITIHCRQWVPIRYFKLIYCHLLPSPSLFNRLSIVSSVRCTKGCICLCKFPYKLQNGNGVIYVMKKRQARRFCIFKDCAIECDWKHCEKVCRTKELFEKKSQKCLINLS